MIKFLFKAEVEIEMNFPEDTPGLLPIEGIKKEADSFEDSMKKVLLDNFVDEAYGKIKVTTKEKTVERV